MIAQAYQWAHDRDNMIVRIFVGNDKHSSAIADLPLQEATDRAADEALRRVRMVRTTRWTETPWGREARVRFTTKEAKR